MTIFFLIKKDIKNVSSSNQLYMDCEILWINTKVDCTTCKATINRLALHIISEVVPRNGLFIHVRVEPVPTPCFISSSVEFFLCLFKKVAWPACRDLCKRASPPSSSEASVRAAKPQTFEWDPIDLVTTSAYSLPSVRTLGVGGKTQ